MDNQTVKKYALYLFFFLFFCYIIRSGLGEDTAQDICSHLKSAKAYLKTDYKIHVSRADPCGDHCSVYALSTDDYHYLLFL